MDSLINFPYHMFLKFSAEHHMAELMALDWFVWIFAVIVLVLPTQWQKPALYAMTLLSAVVMMVCGAKMQSTVVQLASR